MDSETGGQLDSRERFIWLLCEKLLVPPRAVELDSQQFTPLNVYFLYDESIPVI